MLKTKQGRLIRAVLLAAVLGLMLSSSLAVASPASQPTTPTSRSMVTPPACLAGCAQISIASPSRGSTVSSPVRVSGYAVAGGQSLLVRVLDATGYEIGQGSATIYARPGAIGLYRGMAAFTVPPATQPGRIQVYSQSPDDGAIEHLTSVVVTLQGSGLDQAVEQVKVALEAEDYVALPRLMTDPWHLVFLRSESLSLSRERALAQLETNYLGPGQVVVDLSVDARRLLGGQVNLSPDVTHLVYSTGWGADRMDDSFLLFGTDATGRARWGGMIYVFGPLRPYPVPGRGSP